MTARHDRNPRTPRRAKPADQLRWHRRSRRERLEVAVRRRYAEARTVDLVVAAVCLVGVAIIVMGGVSYWLIR